MTSAQAMRVCIDFGTAWSKAAIAPVDPRLALSQVEPLAIGRPMGGNPFLSACAVYVADFRVLFGRWALEAADAEVVSGREPLLSFKTLLSAGDVEALLMQFAARPIDPNRLFRNRDLIVLYLAHLLALVRSGLSEARITIPIGELQWRYATPAWRRPDLEGAHAAIAALFDDAYALFQHFGDALAAREGLLISEAITALRALPGPDDPRAGRPTLNVRPLLESSAAAACHVSGRNDIRCLVVLDMGAGTTDIGGLALTQTAIGPAALELIHARRTLQFAGDMIDRLLMNIVVEKSKDRSLAEQSKLWRQLLTSIRASKETLFLEGKAAFRHRGKAILVQARDLESDRDFKELLRVVAEGYRSALDVAAARAAQEGVREISATLAGGGASAPFLQQILLKTKPRDGRIKVRIEPPIPQWVEARRFGGDLAPVFPQLAIAMGGAIAPDGLMISLAEVPAEA